MDIYFPIAEMSLNALMPARPQQPAKTRAFIDYLVKRLRDHPLAEMAECYGLK